MIRSTFKDTDYFDEYIEFEIETVEDFEDTISNSKGDQIKIGRLQGGIFRAEIHAIIAMYSRGDDIEDIRKFYLELMDKYFKFCNYPGFYMQILWLLSIGIALEVDDKILKDIDAFVKANNLNDKLCDLLLSSRISDRNISTNFEFNNPYKFLMGIEDLPEDEASAKLKEFVDKKWYKGMKDTYWYDNHKSDKDTYYGYWCFEAVGIVKTLGLDDSSLKDSKYYPYDLAHYND